MNNTVRKMQEIIFRGNVSNAAAIAIRQALLQLIELKACTEEEFISLIDLDQQNDWCKIAADIAEKVEPHIRSGRLHPNTIKPWQLCKNYRDTFAQIVHIRAWRSANAAINSIIKAITVRFEHV